MNGPSLTRVIEERVEQVSGKGVIIVMATHTLRKARRLGQDVAVSHPGRLIEHRPAADFFAGAQARTCLAGDLIW